MAGKRKLNLLDGLIILVVIGGILFAAIKLHLLPDVQGEGNVSKKLVYTMEVARADEELTKMVKPGDVVNVGVSGLEQSVVKNVEIEPGEQVLFDKENGRYVKVEIPDKYRMMVTLEGDAAVTPMSIGIGETPVRVGTEFVAKGKGYALVGYVLQADLQ